MKAIKSVLILAIALMSLQACKDDAKTKKEVASYACPMKCEGTKTYDKPGNCPVCGMKLQLVGGKEMKKVLADKISDESIFNLTSTWHTQDNKSIQLKDLKGKTLVMVMIYTTCKAACPILVADIQSIAAEVPEKYNDKVDYVFVSIDPKTDTPARLKAYAKEHHMEDGKWIFLQGTDQTVRQFANVLSVKYKEISPLNFSHSNIISVFNPQGELIHQQEGLGTSNKETVAKIIESAS